MIIIISIVFGRAYIHKTPVQQFQIFQTKFKRYTPGLELEFPKRYTRQTYTVKVTNHTHLIIIIVIYYSRVIIIILHTSGFYTRNTV